MDQRIDDFLIAILPARAHPKSRCGARLMLSMPPAAISSASPARIAWAASMTALSPEPHTLLTVKAAMVSGSPAFRAACRAGFWPSPAWMTFPKMASSICSGRTLPAQHRFLERDGARAPGAGIRPSRRETCRWACERRQK